jgi:LPXTG-site transpeptidase (sortase) family protein
MKQIQRGTSKSLSWLRKPLDARSVLQVAQAVLFLVGAGSLAYCFTVYFAADWYQSKERARFEAASSNYSQNTSLAGSAQPAPMIRNVKAGWPASPAASDPLGMIEIPRLGISSVIEEGTDSKTLLLAVGHMSGTALPGGDGNVVLTAHRDTFFRKLGKLQLGDMINIASVENSYRYRVESMSVVSPSDVYVTKASTGKTLTLITCFPFHYIGPAPMRFVVRAVMQP